MGPRLFSRGNGLCRRTCAAKRRSLQWGRDSSVAEISDLRFGQWFKRGPSMGPRLFSRGNFPNHVTGSGSRQPSMGPRLFSRGNPLSCGLRRGASGGPSMGPRLFSRGNWSHNPSVHMGIRTFNGAATLQSRKWYNRLRRPPTLSSPSMGPRLFSRGNPMFRLIPNPRRINLQWGRDSSVAEMRRASARSVAPGCAFNGAATLQSRKYAAG